MRNYDSKKAGMRMYEERTKQGKSMEQFARDMMVTRKTIDSYEKGITSPDCEYLFRFSKVTGASIDYIIMGENMTVKENYLLSLYRKASENLKSAILTILKEFVH